jgi:hypothetical protein
MHILRRADRAPDLVYLYRGSELFIEITAAYYDEKNTQSSFGKARRMRQMLLQVGSV